MNRLISLLIAGTLFLSGGIAQAATYGQHIEFGPYFISGALAAGAKVYHYSAGTETLKNCWSDRAKTTTVAQPLVADSQGVASAFCDGVYRFVVKSSAGTTLYTFDNVAVADQTQTTTGEGAALASASTLILGTDGDFFHVTGTNAITALSGTQIQVVLAFDAALTLTHSGTFILSHGANYTTVSGDVFAFINEGANVWREIFRATKVSGAWPNAMGSVGQIPYVSGATGFGFGVPGGHLWGLTLSNNGTDATNDIDIAVGEAASTHTTYSSRVMLSLTAALTKRIDATWATGTGNGGRSSSQALADGTWHVCLMRVAGVDDVGFDTSATCANLVTDHSATHVRRIGSLLRESAALVAFVQDGDYFRRKTSVLDINVTNPGTSAVLATLSVPTGLTVMALFNAAAVSTTSAETIGYYSDPATTDVAPSNTLAPLGSSDATINARYGGFGAFEIRTNTSAQIRYRLTVSDATTLVKIATLGWLDVRGRHN